MTNSMSHLYLPYILHVLILLHFIMQIDCFSFIQTRQILNRRNGIVLFASITQRAEKSPTHQSRRNLLLCLPVSSCLLLTNWNPAHSVTSNASQDIIRSIQDAEEVLRTLLDNWEKATVDCTYADVPRELLETKNKELLMEKAATSALFDKSVSVVTCKMNNRIVRDYIGATGKGPLVNIDKKLTSPSLVELINPDSFDEYDLAVEHFIQAIARASSLSYAAGSADLDSIVNFSKQDKSSTTQEGTNLEQTKIAIIEAKGCLRVILKLTSYDK